MSGPIMGFILVCKGLHVGPVFDNYRDAEVARSLGVKTATHSYSFIDLTIVQLGPLAGTWRFGGVEAMSEPIRALRGPVDYRIGPHVVTAHQWLWSTKNGWHACLDGDQSTWVTADSEAEAIGHLVLSRFGPREIS